MICAKNPNLDPKRSQIIIFWVIRKGKVISRDQEIIYFVLRVNSILRFLIESPLFFPFHENFHKRFFQRDKELDENYRGEGSTLAAIHRPKAIKTSNSEEVHERLLLPLADHLAHLFLSTIPYCPSSSRETRTIEKKEERKSWTTNFPKFPPDPSISTSSTS